MGTWLGRRGQKVQIQPLLFSICMLVGLCLSFPSVSWVTWKAESGTGIRYVKLSVRLPDLRSVFRKYELFLSLGL